MNSPAEPKVCARCGAPLTPSALQGLCPRCLLALNVATQTELTGEGAQPQGGQRSLAPEPPTLEEIARHFPGLEILELLGRGGMGAVYKARQKQLDRLVALKILPARRGDDAAFAERFTREAKALARLNHPGIVTLYEFGKVDPQPSSASPQPSSGLYYFLMEYVDGVNLRQLLAGGRIAPREALAIVPQICDALQYAHDQGIVHRDIKPENILLDRRGRVKVADFGLAKLVEGRAGSPLPAASGSATPGGAQETPRPSDLTEAGRVMGTPRYMSPEQTQSPGEVDHRADIYSLGVVFYEMLTGELPQGKFQPPSRKVQVDVRLDEVVLHALEKEPERRYQQASALKTQVETIAATPGDAIPAYPMPRWYRGVDYRSKATLFGLPLVHVTSGIDPATGRQRVAKGIIAIGGLAKGVVAIGGVALGGLAFGGLAVGVFAFGGGAIGLLAMGGGALALLGAAGGAAVAPIAVGGGAFGYYANGGSAFGAHVLDAVTRDPAAERFFLPWAPVFISRFPVINLILLAGVLGVGVGVPRWLEFRLAQAQAAAAPQPRRRGRSTRIAVLIAAALALLLGLPAFWLALSYSPTKGIAPPPGLVGWWRGEGDGKDSAGTNNGILHGGVAFVAGKVGQAFSFNGTDSYVEVPDAPALRLTNELTIETWVKREDLQSEDYLLSKGGDYTRGRANYGLTLNSPQWGSALAFTFAGGYRRSSSITDLNWHHVAVTVRNGDEDPTFYLDGVEQPISERGGPSSIYLYPATAPLQIGAMVDPPSGWRFYSKAIIDEASIYNRALGAGEIQAIFAADDHGKRRPRSRLSALSPAREGGKRVPGSPAAISPTPQPLVTQPTKAAAPARLQFRWVTSLADTNSPSDVLPYDELSYGIGGPTTNQTKLRVLKTVVLDGSAVASARNLHGQGAVILTLTWDGERKWQQLTADNVGRRLAIIWRGRILEAPGIQSPLLGPEVVITGNLTVAEAEQIADTLNHREPSTTSPHAGLTPATEAATPEQLAEPPPLRFLP